MSTYHFGRSCTCGCKRPARELGDYSTVCWMGLTAQERALVKWEHAMDSTSGTTTPLDVLEVWYALPAREPGRGEAA